MKIKLKTAVLILFCMACLSTIHSCKKEKLAEGIDKELFDMSTQTQGFVWYKNSNSNLSKSSGSGHPQPFLKTRYNSTAATKLDANGMIIPGSQFPEGSLIVKELLGSSSEIERYAILYKKSSSAEADAKGWVWGYINKNGTVAELASKKGEACIGCHTQSGNIDYMLMNKFFP